MLVAAVLALTLAAGLSARHLRLSVEERDQLPQSHPYVQLYNRVNAIFGGGAATVIGLVARNGDVFDSPTLAKVERITRAVERRPEFAGAIVWSLAAARVKAVTEVNGAVQIEPLMPSVPDTPSELAALRARALRDDLYVGSIVAADGSATAIVVDLPPDRLYPQFNGLLETILGPERDADTTIVTAGGPVILDYLERYTSQMEILLPIAVVIIGLVHFEAFRTLQAAVLPLVTALVSVVSALGIMGALGYKLDTWSAVTPIAILAVAAGHAVQILKRYYEELARLGDQRRAVVASVVHMAPIMTTAGLIAAAGFASLATFAVTSVRVFGVLMSCGIVSALVIEMTFIPACRVLLPAPRIRETTREKESRWVTPGLHAIATAVGRHPGRVLVFAGLVVVVALVGAQRVHVDGSMRALFPAQSPLRRDEAVINAKFAGTSTFAVLVEGDEDGAVTAPEVLRAMTDLEARLQTIPEVGKTISIADYVRRIHAVMDPASAAKAPIPENRRLIAQYLLLLGIDDLGAFLDNDARTGVVAAYVRSDEAAFATRLFMDVHEFVDRRFAGLPVRVGVAGGTLGAQAALNEVIVREKVYNMMQVAGIIFVLASLAFRSLLGGLFVLAPLSIAAVVTLSVMGWTGTWLTMSTAAALAMGVSIGADFAIYFLFRVRQELAAYDLPASVEADLETSGKAIFYVSSAVTLGYLVLACSGFLPWIHLGGILALLMTVSSLSSVTVLPALVLVGRPRFLARVLKAAD